MKPVPPCPPGTGVRRWPRQALDAMAETVAAQSGGRVMDWGVVPHSQADDPAGHTLLYVTVGTHQGSRPVITTVTASLAGNLVPGPGWHNEAEAPPFAAVRRHSFEYLFWHCHSADPEPLLEYLRCCGVLVLDH